MKCEICGKEVSVCGLSFDVRKEDRLLLCSGCYEHLFHLKYRAIEENVVNAVTGYFNEIALQNDLDENNGGSFGLNGVFIPVTKEYILDHPDHDLSNHSFYTITTDSIQSALIEIRELQDKQAKQQEQSAGFIQGIKEHIDILIGVSVISAVISLVSLFVSLFSIH